MIAKVIAAGPTREAALDRLATALEATVIAGPRSNVAFLAALARSPGFMQGNFDTGYIDRHLADLGAVPQATDWGAAACGVQRLVAREEARVAARARLVSIEPSSPWNAMDGFQLSGSRHLVVPIIVDGQAAAAQVLYGPDGVNVTLDGTPPAPDCVAIESPDAVFVVRAGRQTVVRLTDFEAIDVEHLDSDGVISAPMHGKVLAILVEPGATVTKGQRVAVIEAMKMEHALTAPIDGTVAEIAATAGSQIAEDARVMVIAAAVAPSGEL
jgi:3-methylcrotonyl-CoA carboxylase alpha subunit